MPTATETPWGHWGEPSPTPAWTDAPPKLHGETGGLLKPKYEDTLKWYYKRSTNQSDKEHCLKLLTQFEVQRDAKRLKRSTRPQTAPRRLRQDTIPENPKLTPPPAATHITNAEQIKRDAYQRQLQSIQRLSRPKSRPCSSRQAIIRSERAKDYKTCPRPKSAMADIGRRRVKDPYLTTHESEFPGYPTDLYAEATRPMSSKGFTAPYQIGDPIGGTTCQDEFSWKTCKQVEPIRSGTSSGNRKNNPHPHESFMVWRLPNKAADGMVTSPAKHLGYRGLSNDVLDQIMRDQLKSTYQNDYLGIPQGFQVKDAIDAPKDWRTSIRRPKDTTVRHSYGKPEQQAELAGNTSRYGCNKKKMISALGAVPTVTKDHVRNRELIKGKTSYETAFRPGCSQPDLEKLLKAQTNQKVLDRFLRYSKIEGKIFPPQKKLSALGVSTSQDDYSWKTNPLPVRSKNRSRNNPHPLESFMVWRASRNSLDSNSFSSASIAPVRQKRWIKCDVMDNITIEEPKTTYRNDYIYEWMAKKPNKHNKQQKTPKCLLTPINPLNTTTRISYAKPDACLLLAGNTSRYGCNKNKMLPALGAVPTVTMSNLQNSGIFTMETSYEMAFRDASNDRNVISLPNFTSHSHSSTRSLATCV